MRIAVLYDGGFGHTARLARAVADGVGEVPGAEARRRLEPRLAG